MSKDFHAEKEDLNVCCSGAATKTGDQRFIFNQVI